MLSPLARVLWCLAVAVLTWNTVFDQLVQAGEKRYLALQTRHEAAASIRAVMDPAIRHAAATATVWAIVAAAATALVLIIAARALLRAGTPSSPSPPASSQPTLRP